MKLLMTGEKFLEILDVFLPFHSFCWLILVFVVVQEMDTISDILVRKKISCCKHPILE
jgi:hypothetical protein